MLLYGLHLLYKQQDISGSGISLIHKAAKQKFAPAARLMQIYFATGTHVTKSFVEAFKYSSSTDTLMSSSMCHLIKTFYSKHDEILMLLVFCMQQGIGCKKNEQEAFKQLQQLAKRSTMAQYELALCYLHGKGTPVDNSSAAKHALEAAYKNFAYAENLVGYMYEHSLLENSTAANAICWYRRAANQNDPKSQYDLGKCYYTHKVGKYMGHTTTWHSQAANNGHADAQFCMGNYYASGEGVVANFLQAMNWWSEAANQGHEGAKMVLEQMRVSS